MNLLEKLGIKSQRTKNISKHVMLSALYKGGSILTSFLLVPLTINFLDTTNYGIWLVITSFVSWFSFFDIGLGHGLRNKFAEAKANNNMQLARAYISSAYFLIAIISISLFVLFFIANYFIPWTKVFNTNISLSHNLSIIMLFVFGSFSINFVVKLISTIYTADQRPSMQGLIGLISSVISLVAIYLLTQYSSSSLLNFAIIFSSIPVLVLIAFNFYSFNNKYKDLKPSFKLFKRKYIKDIMGLGLKFFVIQIAAVILYSTDNFIITQLFGPVEVTPYNIAFKYFSIITMAFAIIATPFWSAITDAFIKKDFLWIKKSINNLLKIALVFSIFAVIMVLGSDWFYNIWIGNKVLIPKLLTIFMAIYVITSVLTQPFVFYMNGTGNINIQLVLGAFGAIINIPLSIYFAKYLNMGIEGVILATVVCNVLGLIVYPLYYKISFIKK